MAGPPQVLFLCVHNAGRSQMAAAILDPQGGRPGHRAFGRLGSR